MTITEREAAEGVTVLDLNGKLTHGDSELELLSTAGRLLAEGRRRFLINLEAVPYMDSAGIGALMGVFNRAGAVEGTVKLLNPHRRVYDVLQLVKLDSIFEIHSNEAEALASF